MNEFLLQKSGYLLFSSKPVMRLLFPQQMVNIGNKAKRTVSLDNNVENAISRACSIDKEDVKERSFERRFYSENKRHISEKGGI